jgi:hypothetical protein
MPDAVEMPETGETELADFSGSGAGPGVSGVVVISSLARGWSVRMMGC